MQTKILTSISIFQVDIIKDSAAHTESTVRTSAYHNLWQAVPKEKKGGGPPPSFILVIEATINIIKPKMLEIYREDDRTRTDFIAYDNIFSNLNPTDRA